MFKPGTIRKVEVNNFVTYSHVEWCPGPHLNMVCGPNGTGKSTMVAAIILGLGGSPDVVGRGKKISEYVKHDCENAIIQIWLQDENGDSLLKIKREFDIRNKSQWYLGNDSVSRDGILHYVEKFNIQVNNLCQFLPQDRVQDFAKLDKQQLLIETQKALCRFDLIKHQENLIQYREKQKQINSNIEKVTKDLTTAQDLNRVLETKVTNFKKMKEYQTQIEHIERKMAWVNYEEVRNEYEEVKGDLQNAQKVYDTLRNSVKPIEKQAQTLKVEITKCRTINSKLVQDVKDTEQNLKNDINKIETLKKTIEKMEKEAENKIREIEQYCTDYESANKKIEDIKKVEKMHVEKCAARIEEKQQLVTSLSKLTKEQTNVQHKKNEQLQKKQENIMNINALQNKISNLENVKDNRLRYLQRMSPHAYEAVHWLRSNKHMFKGVIYEPLIMELNVAEPKNAIYLENTISMRDRVAFFCTEKEDMNKLVKCLRESKNLSVNIIHCENNEDMNNFQPVLPIEQIRKYGFVNYVHNLFTAPLPIMHYLCKNYKLHTIPVGNGKTDQCYDNLPSQLSYFFSNKFKYVIRTSVYSKEKSIRQNQINSDGSFSLSLNVVELNIQNSSITNLREKNDEIDRKCEEYDKEISQLGNKCTSLREKIKEIQHDSQQLELVRSRLQVLQKQVKEIENLKRNPDDIKAKAKAKINHHVEDMYKYHESVMNHMKSIAQIVKKHSLISLQIKYKQKHAAFLESKIKDITTTRFKEAEETLNIIKDKHSMILSKAKSLLLKAKQISEGFTPDNKMFDKFRAEYESLSSNINELNNKKEQLLSRIACLNTANKTELNEYETRLNEINALNKNIDNCHSELANITTTMNRLEESWLVPLRQLIAEINLKFALAYEKMHCAGEVSILPGKNEKDFADYGISIKVSYRNGEPLQELNSTVQSGGERAVATAVYMLSLQELTPVPFRCVDEINQGMDANNEKRIFELLFQYTCNQNSSQYFLITPKLVPNLDYPDNMDIHIVHNGPMINEDRKWSFSKFCNSMM